jgi:hypothetical protein
MTFTGKPSQPWSIFGSSYRRTSRKPSITPFSMTLCWRVMGNCIIVAGAPVVRGGRSTIRPPMMRFRTGRSEVIGLSGPWTAFPQAAAFWVQAAGCCQNHAPHLAGHHPAIGHSRQNHV